MSITKIRNYDGAYHSVVVQLTLPSGAEELWVLPDASILKGDVIAEDEKGPHISRVLNFPDCLLTGRAARTVHFQLRPYVRIAEVDEEAWKLAVHIAKTATCRVCEETIRETQEMAKNGTWPS